MSRRQEEVSIEVPPRKQQVFDTPMRNNMMEMMQQSMEQKLMERLEQKLEAKLSSKLAKAQQSAPVTVMTDYPDIED